MRCVLSVCDKAGKGGDYGSGAADVYSDKKIGVILRKLGEQNRRGDVAYYLTGEGGGKERAFFEQKGEKLSDRVYSCHGE